jgi:hypothetical protein
MTNYQIHPDAPTDDDGHPAHPEKGHRICGRTKSDRTTPTDHGRERDDIPYCTLVAGWGVDGSSGGACSHHGGAGGGPEGEANGNWKHGGFSEVLTKGLTEREEDAIDEIAGALGSENPDDQFGIIRRQAAEAYVRYRRSGDSRHLREYRQLISEFNIVDNTDHVEVGTAEDWREYISEGEDG